MSNPNQTTMSPSEIATAQISGYISALPPYEHLHPQEIHEEHGPIIKKIIEEAFN